MDTRTATITKNLSHVPGAKAVSALIDNIGKTDGVGYEVEHVRPGRGFSSTEYAYKTLPNGRVVCRHTYRPGPFDGLAGLSTDIKEAHLVWMGWEQYTETSDDHTEPPQEITLPASAFKWHSNAWDGPRNWFADFGDDFEAAEAFAATQTACKAGDEFPPMTREETV